MFPKTLLPNTTFTFGDPYFQASFGARQSLHKADFDALSAIGKIVIPRWQCPHRVHMIGQHDPGIDIKWPLPLGNSHRFAQFADMPHQ